MKSKTQLNTLTEKEITKLTKFCLMYCEMTFGINKRKRRKLTVKVKGSCRPQPKTFGWYDSIKHTITLFTKRCKTVGEFTSTFIHEYTHSMQPCRTQYMKLYKIHGYVNHPFEIQAYATEKVYNKKLLNTLRKSYQLINQ